MTIYKVQLPGAAEQKLLKKTASPPEVVQQPRTREVRIVAVRNLMTRRCLVAMSVALLLLLVSLTLSVYYYHRLVSQTYYGRCGVRVRDGVGGSERTFEQTYELDVRRGRYERLRVPGFMRYRPTTVVHDFSLNQTAIVDERRHLCFLLPLNRTVVAPPRTMWELINNLKSGAYLPTASLSRGEFAALTPPVRDLSPYGRYIWAECRAYASYRLVKVRPSGQRRRRTRASEELLEYSLGQDNAADVFVVAVYLSA